eukprot:2178474-Alexandrium_andersonii.AAC.1
MSWKVASILACECGVGTICTGMRYWRKGKGERGELSESVGMHKSLERESVEDGIHTNHSIAQHDTVVASAGVDSG